MMADRNGLLHIGSVRLQKKYEAAKRAFESCESFVRWLETDETAHGRTEERTIWKNQDLDLTPRKAWSWGWYDYAAFWWSYGFSTGVWSAGSSMVAMGLNAWQGDASTFEMCDRH
jgi:NCS1 family nucleobase:cation symporter-1